MVKKKVISITVLFSVILLFTYFFLTPINVKPPTLLVANQTSSEFGVYPQFVSGATPYLKPDVWELCKEIGATRIVDYHTYLLPLLDEAQANNIKLSVTLLPQPNIGNIPSMWTSSSAMTNYLSSFNLAQYRNHPAIDSWLLTDEPFVMSSFDASNPPTEVLNTVSVGIAASNYIRSQDPTHPVSINLNAAGSYGDMFLQYKNFPSYFTNNLAKAQSWIRLWMPASDFLARSFYLFGSGSFGRPWSDFPTEFHAIADTYLDMFVEESQGKKVRIATGCQSSTDDEGIYHDEAQQNAYFFLMGEKTKQRNIEVDVFQLVDHYTDSRWDYGVFNENNDGYMNIPKLCASNLKSYFVFDVTEPPVEPPEETTYKVTINPSTGGTTIPSHQNSPVTATSGQTLTIQANPSIDYNFDSFVVNGESVLTNPLQLVVTTNTQVTAMFELDTTEPPVEPPIEPKEQFPYVTFLPLVLGFTVISVVAILSFKKKKRE